MDPENLFHKKAAAEGSAARHAQTAFSRSTLTLQTWCCRKSRALLKQHTQAADKALSVVVAFAGEELGDLFAAATSVAQPTRHAA